MPTSCGRCVAISLARNGPQMSHVLFNKKCDNDHWMVCRVSGLDTLDFNVVGGGKCLNQ